MVNSFSLQRNLDSEKNSTQDNLAIINTVIHLAVSNKDVCIAVFIGIEGAFVNVFIPILKTILLGLGLPLMFVQYIIAW